VDIVKFDPYLNIDPGTMSPFEHGEVYVLDDGSETDLDLGHYERFLNTNLTKNSSVTAGKIYDAILTKEREGDYLGKNVQLIPNVTNYIIDCFERGVLKSGDFVRLIEIGGSTGDMEGEIFLESFRQFKQKHKENVLHLHLGYVPFLDCSGEFKTKPLQNSIRELLRTGLQPDVIFARYAPEGEMHLDKEILNKIALFSNLPENRVISLPDKKSIYYVPLHLQNSSILEVLEDFTGKKIEPKIPEFYSKIKEIKEAKNVVKIGVVSKYSKLEDAYLSLAESLKIAGVENDTNLELVYIDSEKLENPQDSKFEKELGKLKSVQGVIVPGGFGVRVMEGKIAATKYARENKIPFLGICLGLQMAVVEFARNEAGIKAYSSEMLEGNEELKMKNEKLDLIIDYIPEQKEIHKKGGTMRLGGYNCDLVPGTLAEKMYQNSNLVKETRNNGVTIRERHRHRLEVQGQYLPKLEEKGLIISGKHAYKGKDGEGKFLVELIELSQNTHPYFIATQSHPEFLSRPQAAHPLFKGLIEASLKIKRY